MAAQNFDKDNSRRPPAQSPDEQNPLDVLSNLSDLLRDIPSQRQEAVIKALFRAYSSILHPDKIETGNADAFRRVQGAYDRFFATPGMTRTFLQEFGRQEPLHIRIDKEIGALQRESEGMRAQLKALVNRLEENFIRFIGKSRETSPSIFNAAPCVISLTDSRSLNDQFDEQFSNFQLGNLEDDDSSAYEVSEMLQRKHEFQIAIDEDGNIRKIQNGNETLLEGRVLIGTVPEAKFEKIRAKLQSGADSNALRITGSTDAKDSVYSGATIIMPGQFASMILPNLNASLEGGSALITLTKTREGVIYYAVEGMIGKQLKYDDGSAINLL